MSFFPLFLVMSIHCSCLLLLWLWTHYIPDIKKSISARFSGQKGAAYHQISPKWKDKQITWAFFLSLLSNSQFGISLKLCPVALSMLLWFHIWIVFHCIITFFLYMVTWSGALVASASVLLLKMMPWTW